MSRIQKLFRRIIWLVPILIGGILFSASAAGVIVFGHGARAFYNLFGIFGLNWLLGLLMIYAMTESSSNLFIKLLNWKPFVFIGLLSYSIYLWQQPWLYSGWDIPLYLQWLGIAGSALISYYLIEEPFLKWRDKILAKKYARQIPNEVQG